MNAVLLAVVLSQAGSFQTEQPIAASSERVVAAYSATTDQVSGVRGWNGVKERKKEGFFSATNLVIGAGLFGTTIADVETTFTCFGTSRTDITTLPNGDVRTETWTCHESNRHRRANYEAGRGKVYPVNLGANGALWVGSHFLRRSDKKILRVLGYAGPAMFIFFQGKMAIDNTRVTNQIRTGR